MPEAPEAALQRKARPVRQEPEPGASCGGSALCCSVSQAAGARSHCACCCRSRSPRDRKSAGPLSRRKLWKR